MENNQTKEPYVGFQDPGESAQGGYKLDNDRLSQDPWSMEHKQTEPAPNELFLNPMERASHYETGPGSYSVQDVHRSRASWAMEKKKKEAAPDIELQVPRESNSYYETRPRDYNIHDFQQSRDI
ncbi:unnamed protein product, partial [Meganyctiphanes norvegica]